MNYVWLQYSQPTCTLYNAMQTSRRMMHMTFTFAEKSVSTFLKKKLHHHIYCYVAGSPVLMEIEFGTC